jgi:hypothetical protein
MKTATHEPTTLRTFARATARHLAEAARAHQYWQYSATQRILAEAAMVKLDTSWHDLGYTIADTALSGAIHVTAGAGGSSC